MVVLAGMTWKLCGPMHEMRLGYKESKCMTGCDYMDLYHGIVGILVGWAG